MGQAGPPTARRVYIYGHFPEKKFTKDRPRHRVDDEHHFEGGLIATRKLDSPNERLQREGLWGASTVSGTTSPSSAIAWRSAHHAAIFVKASSFKLLLCKLITNPTLIAHAPFIFECIYMTYMPPWSPSGLALLQGTHLRGPYRRRDRRFPRKALCAVTFDT